MKKLNESHNDIKESIEDLKNMVIFQNQSRPQSANVGTDQKSNIETQFCFQQPLKNIMFEDQSEAIQRLNQFIKNLKEDNLTGLVSLTVAMCFRENFAYIFLGWK